MSGALLIVATTVAFRGAALIDGTGAAPVPDSLLVVAGGKIVSAGPASRAALDALPPGTDVVDVPGAFIVPGLVDGHVHADTDADLAEMLRWGVTSARLMAEDSAAARATARRAAETGSGLPDLFPAAPIFTARGGWWDAGHPVDPGVNRFPATAAAARAAVRESGAVEIKLMWDDMAWCRAPLPPLTKIDPEVARALLGEAASRGIRASVHAPNLADARAAVLAGATVLAHGVLEPIDAATVAAMKERPIFYIPTMDVFEFLADTAAFVGAVLSDPVAEDGLPAAVRERYRSPEYDARYREGYPNRDGVRKALPALRKNLLDLHRAGVPVALGTDMWAFPGLGVSIEMDLWVKAGFPPLEALRAATQVSARSLAATDRGTLEPGKRADFLVLDADPLRDPKNLRRIRWVYKAGARVFGAPRVPGGRADGR